MRKALPILLLATYACAQQQAVRYTGQPGAIPVPVAASQNGSYSPVGAASSVPASVSGAIGDGIIFTDGAITSSTSVFSSAASTFTSGDVGKLLQVYGAGGTNVISTPVFYGTGLSTLTQSGTYTGTTNRGYCVYITATDHFSWGTFAPGTSNAMPWANCANGAASVAITGSAQSLSNGVSVTFGSTTGYTIGDAWIITAQTGVLATTISGYTSAHVVTLAASATATVTGANGAYGSNNSTQIAAAISAATSDGAVLLFPKGIYLTNAQVLIQRGGVSLAGETEDTTLIYAGSGSIDGAVKFAPTGTVDTSCSNTTACLFFNGAKNLTIRGNANAASALLIVSTHHSNFGPLRLADANYCFNSQFAVSNVYLHMECTSADNQGTRPNGFLWAPQHGFVLGSPATSLPASTSIGTWYNTVVEGVISTGIWIQNGFLNIFTGGTLEIDGGRSIVLSAASGAGSAGSGKNIFDSIDLEQNGNDIPGMYGTNDQTLNMYYNGGENTRFRGGIYMPNSGSSGYALYAKTTGGVDYAMLTPYSDNNLYIGSNAQVGSTIIRAGNSTVLIPMLHLSFGTGAGDTTFVGTGATIFNALKTTGSATGKKVVCVDTATGQIYASSTGTDCSN